MQLGSTAGDTMAGNTVNVNLSVQDQGGTIKRRTDEARALNSELERSKRLAAGGGAGAGTRALAAQNIEYGRGRGVIGSTGASARDFANQAQGLGGLVQLYATYAANVFAVGAAFRALSEAMNTANMVEGLNQLGAASGVALGALAKEFQKTTGNALSLRESVEAVSKASSAGLSSKQILEISAGATKASQVLGLALPDAVSRLTRGIVKLEPELLDELGIFTKIGPAVDEYSRNLGRTATSLSDFERRQAFALAVLKEVETKYGKISIPTNPYDKLLATLKDISVTGLQVINTVLAPIVKLLSESPVGLAAVIGLLAKNLLGRVIPAIRDYTSYLDKSSNTAVANYVKEADAAKKAREARIRSVKQERLVELEALEDRKNRQLEALQTEAEARKRINAQAKTILAKPIQEVTDQDLARLDKLGKRTEFYKQAAKELRALKLIDEDIAKINDETNKQIAKRPGLFTAAGAAQAREEAALQRAKGREIVRDVGVAAREEGMGAAAKRAIEGIRTEKLGIVTGTITGVGSAAVIAAEGVSRLATAFSRFLGWIGLIVSAYEIFDAIFSKNGKQIEAYNASLDALTESTKTATATAKLFGDQLSVQSIVAKSNALNTLSEDVGKVSSSLLDADQIASWWDRRIDDLLVIFGKDLRSKFVEQVSPALVESLKVISDPELKAQAEAGFRELLSIKPETKLDLKAVAESLRDLDAEGFREIAPLITQQLNQINKASKAISNPLKSLKDDFSNLEKSYQELSNTFIAQDPLTRFALNLNKVANTLNNALTQSINKIAILSDIAKDPNLIKGFPSQVQEQITTTIKQIAELESIIKSSREILNPPAKAATTPSTAILGGGIQAMLRRAEESRASYQPTFLEEEARSVKQDEARRTIAEAQAKVKELQNSLIKAITEAGNQAVKVIEDGVKNTFRQVAIDIQKGILGYLPKTPETIKISADLERESIQVRREELTRIRELIISNDKLRIVQDLSRLALEREKLQGSPENADEIARLTKSMADLEQQRQAYMEPGKLPKPGSGGTELLTEGTLKILSDTAEYRKQLAKLGGEEVLVTLRQTIDTAGAAVTKAIEDSETRLKQLKTANAAFLEQQKVAGESPENIAARKLLTDTEERRAELALKLLNFDRDIAQITAAQAFSQEQLRNSSGETAKIWYGINASATARLKTLQEQRDAEYQSLSTADRIALAEETRTNTAAQLTRSARTADEIAQQTYDRVQQTYALDISRTSQSLEELQTRQQVLMLSDQEVANERNLLERKLLKLETEKRVFELQESQRKALKDIEDQIIALRGLDEERRQELDRQKEAAKASYQAQIDGEIELYNRKVKNRDLTERLNERQKNYDQTFTNAFKNMGDAIVQWAETGKWAGKELFASLTKDLLRYELQLQMLQLYGTFRTPLLSLVGQIPGTIAAPAAAAASGSQLAGAAVMGLPAIAKGAAYDRGIETFGRGGMFTNSIVTDPTLFKFARGTGLMGEAGPEAIMPLKRDNQGNLGVSGGGANVEVVINNTTGQPATARQSTDSRGNRKIEVVVGDMVAGELSRTGSGPQTAMRNMFNVQPRLTRR